MRSPEKIFHPTRFMSKAYYELLKPGIIYGNALVATAGFFFASHGHINWALFVFMLVGLSCIIGAACAVNNVLDHDMDARMERTKKRPTVTGEIPRMHALLCAAILAILGTFVLALYTTPLALGFSLAGLFIYVCLYTPLKPKSPSALFVGALAGAVPPVVGYTAVTNTFDQYALVLFVALYLWQIPHFLSIATYRYTEYASAGVPLYIQKEPSSTTKRRARMVFYFSLVVLLLACGALMLQR